MKNNLMRVVLVLCLCAVVFAVWNKDKPASSTSLRNSNPLILGNWSALETALAQDHEFSTGGTNSGKHEVLTMEEEASAGASATNELHVQAIDGGSGQPEFAITSEDGIEIQITSAGKILSASLDMKDEDNMSSNSATHAATQQSIKAYSDSATQTMTNKTLTSPVINTAISGTAFLDEDTMSSDSATKVASQQSIKAYADTKEATLVTQSTASIFGSWTTLDSIGGTLVKDEVYKVGSDGFITAYSDTLDNGEFLRFFTDGSNPPTTVRSKKEKDANMETSLTCPVRKGDYWKVTCTDVATIYWLPIGTGTCVKQ